ncbi:hypothetical protein ACORG1_34410 (plasmid) [Mycobacterium sp. TJFP1]
MDWPKTPGRDSRHSSAFDISWPYRDHHMMDFLAHATGNAIVDEYALPAELAAKRRRRGHLHTPYPQINWRHPAAHPGWRYTRSERRALRAATIHWPASRQDLAAYANRDVLEAEWDTRFTGNGPEHAGAAALVWREPNAVAAAFTSAKSARHSRLWKTDFLDAHNARLDIDAVLARIVTTAHRLWRTHADTHLHLGATDTTTWTALLAAVDHLTDYARALNGRADLLLAYREVLRLENVDDAAIRIEFGLPLDDTTPLNRTALDMDLNVELTALASQLARSALFDEQDVAVQSSG